MNQRFHKYVYQIIAGWPVSKRAQAINIINKYGLPKEMTANRLTWYCNGLWKRTIIHRIGRSHTFPFAHSDYLEQTISYKVPEHLNKEIANFKGHIYPDPMNEEVTAVCHDEMMNVLSLNLLHDLLTKKRTVNEANRIYEEIALKIECQGDSSPYGDRLLFQPQFEAFI